MAKLSVKEIRDLARQIVASWPGGTRYEDLRRAILSEHPDTRGCIGSPRQCSTSYLAKP
jgi:hypothetical protein